MHTQLEPLIKAFHSVSSLEIEQRKIGLSRIKDATQDIRHLYSVEDVLSILARNVSRWIIKYKWITSYFNDLGLEDLYNTAMADIAVAYKEYNSEAPFYAHCYVRVKHLIVGEINSRCRYKRGSTIDIWTCTCGYKNEGKNTICGNCGSSFGEESTIRINHIPDLSLEDSISSEDDCEEIGSYYDIIEDKKCWTEESSANKDLLAKILTLADSLPSYSGHDLGKLLRMYLLGATTREIALAAGMKEHLLCRSCGKKIEKSSSIKQCPYCNGHLIQRGTEYLYSIGGQIIQRQIFGKLRQLHPEADFLLKQLYTS